MTQADHDFQIADGNQVHILYATKALLTNIFEDYCTAVPWSVGSRQRDTNDADVSLSLGPVCLSTDILQT